MLLLLLQQLKRVLVLQLLLVLTRALRQFVQSLLEVPLRVLAIFLCNVPLLFKEFEFSLPKGLIAIVCVGYVLVLPIQVSVLLALSFQLLLHSGFISVQCQLQLLVGLSKASDFRLGGLCGFPELSLEIAALFRKHRTFPLSLRCHASKP